MRNSNKKYQKEDNPFEDPEIAKLWIKSVEGETGLFRDRYIYPLLKKWLKNPKINKVLDLGAGQGITAQFCIGKEYIGLEPSKELLKRAKQKYGEFGNFIKGSAYNLPFDNESFDGVFSINVWFHLQFIERAASELSRVLKRGGQFLIINPNPESYDIWLTSYEDVKKEDKKFEGKAHIPLAILPRNIFYMHTEKEILDTLKKAGLVISKSRSFAAAGTSKNRKLFRYYTGGKIKKVEMEIKD